MLALKVAIPSSPNTQACCTKLSFGTSAIAAQAKVKPLNAEPSKNMRRQPGLAWRCAVAASNAATWITRRATSASSHTSQTPTSR